MNIFSVGANTHTHGDVCTTH